MSLYAVNSLIECRYGGSFASGLSLPVFLWVIVALVAVGLYPFACLAEVGDFKPKSYLKHFSELFVTFEHDAIWRVALSMFLVNLFSSFMNNVSYDVAKQWYAPCLFEGRD